MKSNSKANQGLPLIVIVGPTASGKTSSAIEIASRCNGEIICADSRSIYKNADIGTAKPTIVEQSIIPHWGLDLVEPGEYFSASDFKKYTDKKIAEIRSRGHIPLLVGGTGLYIDSVVFDYKFGSKVNEIFRSKLQQKTLDELYEYCKFNNISLPENYKNKRYVVRSIERNNEKLQRNNEPQNHTIIVGITTEKHILRSRIISRVDQLIENGVVDEAKKLGDTYGWNNESMKSNAYPLIHLYLNSEISLDDLKRKLVTLDWRLAKRQLTWFRRNRFIHWLSLDDVNTYLSDRLAIHK